MKILVVDDHPLIAEGLTSLLRFRAGTRVTTAATALAGLAAFAEEAPDITVIDVNLPDRSGLDLLSELRADHPSARLIVLTFDDDAVTAARALNAGASGFVSKSDPADAILDAIDVIAKGRPWLPPRLVQDVARLRSRDRLSGFELTERELTILRSLAYGESMNELAFRQKVSYKTISNDCASLRERFGAKSLPELVRIALTKRLID